MGIPSALAESRHINLITFRRTGVEVPTPVGFLADGGELVLLTPRNSGKVKRIRNNPSVRVTPCDSSGRSEPGAPTLTGRARLLDKTETARVRRLLARRFPIAGVVFAWNRLIGRTDRWVGVAVTI